MLFFSSLHFSPTVPKCIFQHLILNTLSLSSLLNMTDQVSHSYKTGEVIRSSVHFNLSVLRHKIFCAEWPQAFPEFNLLLMS